MGKVPGSLEVTRSLTTVRRNLKSCLTQVNQQAGILLAKGHYDRAEALVQVARAVEGFRTEIIQLQERWKEIKGHNQGSAREGKTPLWEYYRPLLETLESLGGEARTKEILESVHPRLEPTLKLGDLEVMSGGRPRWNQMVRRTKRAMTKEGFLTDTTGQVWKITAAGRRVATSGNALGEKG